MDLKDHNASSPPVTDEAAATLTDAVVPTYAKLGVTQSTVCARLRVVDATTGDLIVKVIEADADAGRIVRYAVEDGALVRENDRFAIIEEDRAIRLEWLTGKQRKNSF